MENEGKMKGREGGGERAEMGDGGQSWRCKKTDKPNPNPNPTTQPPPPPA